MLTQIKRLLRCHPAIKKFVESILGVIQRFVWMILDTGETLSGSKNPLTPPRRLMNVGSNEFTRSDFNSIGDVLFQYLVDVGGLKPDDKVLDAGCGVGRMAIPLSRYLSGQGSYDGFDIVKESVEYCNKTYSPHFENFHFHHADLFSTTYNPNGKHLSHDYKFPFPDQTFSFIFLTSVFTHMLSPGIENYLNEINRVLVPGGRCFGTFFILNEETENLTKLGQNSLNFDFEVDKGKTTNANSPEDAMAFNESFIREIYQKSNLDIVEPLHHGSWCGMKSAVGYQDIIIATKLL